MQLVKVKIKKGEGLTILFFVLYVIVYFISILVYGMGSEESQVRYYFLACIVVISLILFMWYFDVRLKKILYGKKLLYIVIVAGVFLIMSVDIAEKSGGSVYFRTYVQVALLLLPALYVFCLINLLSMKTIICMMQFLFVTTVIVYFLEPSHTILEFLKMSNWAQLSLGIMSSNSFTESNICSGLFVNLFLFFKYFENAKLTLSGHRLSRWWSRWAFVFTCLSFKRLSILFMFVVIITIKLLNMNKKPSNKAPIIFASFFTIATCLYTKFMIGKLFPDFDVYNFTTGRDYILSLWEAYNYVSYGYGSSMILIGRYLEMDLVQIYMELSLAAVFLFCFAYAKIADDNRYSILVLVYVFFNMLTASSIPMLLDWIVTLITISTVGSCKLKDEVLLYG